MFNVCLILCSSYCEIGRDASRVLLRGVYRVVHFLSPGFIVDSTLLRYGQWPDTLSAL